MSRRNAKKNLRCVLVSPEATPFGGHGELPTLAGELAARLHDRGWDVELVLADGPGPRASELSRGHARREALAVELGGEMLRGELWRCQGADDLPVSIVAGEALAGADEARRLGFFAQGALEVARRGERAADVLHLFGPGAALVAAYLDATPPAELAESRSVFSFVDLDDDLAFERGTLERLGLPAGLQQPQLAEHHGHWSLLKTGLVFADALAAASPRYAREITTASAGHGFEALLAERGKDLLGIAPALADSWNPAQDTQLAASFSAERPGGRSRCRAALQAELGLGKSTRAPLLAFVGELRRERGIDLVLDALPELLAAGAQLVIAGRGEPTLEQRALAAAREHPLHVAVSRDADDGLERRILAGADLFLAPYRVAPSGERVARAMRYGAVPVVHAAGALAELVTPHAADEAGAAPGNGFMFRTASAAALARAVTKALTVLRDPKTATALRRAAMEAPAGWAGAVRRYEDLLAGVAKRTARRVVIPPPAPPPEAPAPAAGEPYIDWGPALPQRYGEDALALLVQGPRSVYAYWELAPDTYARAGGTPALALRLEGGRQIADQLGDYGEYWFETEPGSRLAVELVDATGRVLLRSAAAETPREAPSEHSAVREVDRDRRQRGEIVVPPSPPVPQPLYHFAADGPVSRYGPNAWQEEAAHPRRSEPVGNASSPRTNPPLAVAAPPLVVGATAAAIKPPAAEIVALGGSSPAGVGGAGSAPAAGGPAGSSEHVARPRLR